MKGLRDTLGHSRPVYLNRAAMVRGLLDGDGRPLVTRFNDWLSLYRQRTKWGRGLKLMLHKINLHVMLHYPHGRTFAPGPDGSRAFAAELFGDDPVTNLVTEFFVSKEDWDVVRNLKDKELERDVWQAKLLAEYSLQLYLLVCYGSTVYDCGSGPGSAGAERAMFY